MWGHCFGGHEHLFNSFGFIRGECQKRKEWIRKGGGESVENSWLYDEFQTQNEWKHLG
jgi:hypothetical protein